MYQKPYTCTELNVLLHFSDLKALINFYGVTMYDAHMIRDPEAFQPQRAESKLTYYTTIIK